MGIVLTVGTEVDVGVVLLVLGILSRSHFHVPGDFYEPVIESMIVFDGHHFEAGRESQKQPHDSIHQRTPIDSPDLVSYISPPVRNSEKDIPASRIITVNLAKTKIAMTVTAKLSPVVIQHPFHEALIITEEVEEPRRLTFPTSTYKKSRHPTTMAKAEKGSTCL